MPATTVDSESNAPAVGGVRATWWNAVASLVVAVVASHVPLVVYLLAEAQGTGGAAGTPGLRIVAVGLVGAVSLVAQLAMIPWLRGGLGGGVASPAVAVVAPAAGIALWMLHLDAGLGVLPLVAALSLLACASGRAVRRPVFVIALGAAVLSWAVADTDLVTPATPLFTVLYPYLVWGTVWAWDVVARLDVARATEADLAVTR